MTVKASEVELGFTMKDPASQAAVWCKNVAEHEVGSLLEATMFSIKELERWTPLLQLTIDIARELRNLPLALLTGELLGNLKDAAKLVAERFAELKEAAIKSRSFQDAKPELLKSWESTRDGFMGAVSNNCNAFCNIAIPLIPYLRLKSEASPWPDTQAREQIERLEHTAGTALEKFKGYEEEVQRVIKVVQETAAQQTVAQHARRFGEIAVGHDQAARRWLYAAAGFVAAALAVAIFFLFFLPVTGDPRDVVVAQKIIGKLLVVSALYFIALWAAKMYRNNRHLAELNKHRHAALQTFDAMVIAGSQDEQTKNAVLLEATRCIFAPANTGYLGGSDEDSQSSRIVEIVKTVGSGVGK